MTVAARKRPIAAKPAPPTENQPPVREGWPPEPAERLDFYHRVRAFPPSVARWRKELAARIAEDAPSLRMKPQSRDLEGVREALDDGVAYLREVDRILAVLHGTPRLGNKEDPVDELVYIILSRKTREGAYVDSFDALRKRFKRWDDLLKAPRSEVERLVRSSGLSTKKTASLYGALGALRDKFGACTLEPAREWSDAELEAFLCSLPEVSRKSAYCIMLYSFGRTVFPADTHVGRILQRLGPYEKLGLDLEGLDHKQLQAALADLVPPNLRYSLHVNLVAHGREVCSAGAPACTRCELRPFCKQYRRTEASRIAACDDLPTVVDLFCGAGGSSTGFGRAGFRVVAAVDTDPVALRTYRLNHPGVPDESILERDVREIRAADIRRLLGRRTLDVLAGSPPCQGFSHVGMRSKQTKTGYEVGTDDRNFLYEEMIRLALELRPRLFLMENVPGMQSARRDNLSFIEEAARRLRTGGYETAIWRLNASGFGVPQDRLRFFLAGSRVSVMPGRPTEAYQDRYRPDYDPDGLPPVTLHDAISDLPPVESSMGEVVARAAQLPDSPGVRRYVRKFGIESRGRLLYNHAGRYNNSRDLELYALLRQGEDSVHAIERHGRSDLMRYRRDVFDDKYARLRSDRPGKTIVSHLAKDGNGYIHPTQTRSITVREAARLQSFPDDFVFCGSPSDQWVQVGNAVPPLLAEAIARSFLRALQRSA